MDTEKAILDTELYQERLSFCVQILSFFTTNFIGHCAVVQNCWFFTKSACKKKKKERGTLAKRERTGRCQPS